MKRYYLTFGQKYRQNLHPLAVNGIYPHPDGWVTIEADTYDEAKEIAYVTFGVHWSFIYTLEPDVGMFPRGELTVIRRKP